MIQQALIIMAKRPQAGRTKTRLTPPLTPTTAAALYAGFLADVITLAGRVPGVTPIIAYAPGDDETAAYFATTAPDVKRLPQRGQSLNERLHDILSRCLTAGFERVAAINSDSPTLPHHVLSDGFTRLQDAAVDVVLGPCDDGGYYFIGIKRPCPPLILDVTMSTPHVFEETVAVARREGLTVSKLPTWYDVDSAADLARLWKELADDPSKAPNTQTALRKISPSLSFVNESP